MLDLTIRAQGVPVRLRIPERDVFVPNLVGLLDATQLRVNAGDVVCDVGTGSGFLGILAAKLGAQLVYGLDVSPAAVANARRNAALNGVADRCRFSSETFSAAARRLRGAVDLLISTLPNTPSRAPVQREPAMLERPRVSRFLKGGADGADLSVRMLRAFEGALSPSGRVHTHLVAWSNTERLEAELRRSRLRVRTLARACVPVWGQRCNALQAYRQRPVGHRWLLRFGDLPSDPACRVRVIEAGAAQAAAAPERKPAEVSVQVLP